MTQTAEIQGDGNIIIQASGSGHSINVNLAHLTLTTHAKARARKPQRDLDLLIPEAFAVPLIGRNHDKRSLLDWLHTSRPISVRAITGAGGSGKTRLALELMLQAHKNSWAAGFVSHREIRRFLEKQNLSTWGWQKNTFIVVDYAASVAGDLRTWFSELAESEKGDANRRLRLLLLERHASANDGWYQSLGSAGSDSEIIIRDLFDPWEPASIHPIGEITDRHAIFTTILEQAATLRSVAAPSLPSVGTDEPFDRRLLDPQWADPLMLMMAGLATIDTGVPTALSLSRPEVASYLARREVRRIQNFAPNEHAGNFLVHLAAVATLSGGLSPSDCLRAAEQESTALGLIYPNGSGAAVADLRKSQSGSPGIEPIRPDLIGEAFLLQIWKTNLPDNVFDRALRFARKSVVGALVRTAQDFAAVDNRPTEWLRNLVSSTSDVELLNLINDSVPLETVCLREVALQVVDTLILLLSDSNENWAIERARLMIHTSNRQSLIGQREQALASIEEAVRIYRTLATARPDAFLPELALSLNNLSNGQGELGQREPALTSSEEAVRIHRTLAATRPDAFLPGLASSLNNLSNQQSDLGQRESALASIEEAVRIRRRLAATRPDAFLPDLALSLNNLSVQQSGLGRREAALASIEEAVGIYRTLAAARPDAFLPDLALSLNTLSNRQSELGPREQALASIEEAVSIRRTLAAARPDAFLPHLAQSLNNLSLRQSELGHREQALANIEEAVRIRRTLAAVRPDAFLPDLARSLGALGYCHAAMDNAEAAWTASAEALLYLGLGFTRYPAAFAPLAQVLLDDYLTRSETLNRQTDPELLEPFLHYFNQP